MSANTKDSYKTVRFVQTFSQNLYVVAKRLFLYNKGQDKPSLGEGGESVTKKRLTAYGAGLLVMAFGIVLIKKANLGVSPISSIPSAAANLTPLTFGEAQTLFQLLCVLLQAFILKRVTAPLLLQIPLSAVFGRLIDGFMAILPLSPESMVPRCGLCLAGIGCTALGIVLIVEADMILPAPDAMLRLLSRRSGRPLGRVKLLGDVLWTVCSVLIEWAALGRVLSVGLGTAASALLTGNLVSLLRRTLPQPAGAAEPHD